MILKTTADRYFVLLISSMFTLLSIVGILVGEGEITRTNLVIVSVGHLLGTLFCATRLIRLYIGQSNDDDDAQREVGLYACTGLTFALWTWTVLATGGIVNSPATSTFSFIFALTLVAFQKPSPDRRRATTYLAVMASALVIFVGFAAAPSKQSVRKRATFASTNFAGVAASIALAWFTRPQEEDVEN